LLAWDVDKLVALTAALKPVDLPLDEIGELDEPFWFSPTDPSPTCRRVAEHARLMEQVILDYPIIVDPAGRVMDGMHRVGKAWLVGMLTIKAFRLPALPEPDFVGVPASELPY
jgi:hypothetical protein